MNEYPIVFDCDGDELLGVVHPGSRGASTGIVIVVGGPQYRVGSHRQFVLMARALASAGYPVLRFDYRGMGDSRGNTRPFDGVDDDIGSAIDQLINEQAPVETVVLLGLCDAASACLIYGHRDSRVIGQILLNPWVRSEEGEAKSYLRRYYFRRLLQGEFWKKLLRGGVDLRGSFTDLARKISTVIRPADGAESTRAEAGDFKTRMLNGIRRYTSGALLLIISEKDLTAGEFTDLCRSDSRWRDALASVSSFTFDMAGADHTLSRREHLEAVCAAIVEWLGHTTPGLRS